MSSFSVLSTAVTSAPRCLGQLDHHRPDAAAGAIDQDPFAAPNIGCPNKVQGFQPAHWHGGGFRVSQVGWFDGQRSTHHAGGFGHTFVLGIRAEAETGRGEDLVAGFELAHLLADSFNFPGQLLAKNDRLGPKETD